MSAVPASVPAANICPQCGVQFRCGMEAGDTECWCASLPAFAPLPADAGPDSPAMAGCFCPACLKARLAEAARHADAYGR